MENYCIFAKNVIKWYCENYADLIIMRRWSKMITNQIKKCLSVLLVFVMICGAFAVVLMPTPINAVSEVRGTGYDSADDVQYVYAESGKYLLNWGYQGEKCVFLSDKAQDFYTGEYVYADMSASEGITSLNDPMQSELYSELKSLMTTNHSHITTYEETKNQYKYTDCEKNDSSKIYLFYCGATYNSEWEKGYTWNREHVWPNSKCLTADTEKNDSADIMMLRPVHKSENSSRNNKAYGNTLTEDYFVPGETVKGDCARVLLYYATRWGNIDKMFGPDGVIEDLDTLLQWMEQDPVDTWEMGRNDAVQQITGTRNVFVDYPEYAWLLFGEEIPEGYQSPSDNDGVITLTDRTTNDTDYNGRPDVTADGYKYTFENYAPGVAYAENEVHVLDDIITLTTNKAYFTTEWRLYKNSSSVFESNKYINSMVLSAKNGKGTIKVSASADGKNWTAIKSFDVPSGSNYAEYNIDLDDNTYQYVKFESVTKAIYVQWITVKYGAQVVEGGENASTPGTETEISTEPNTTETQTEIVTTETEPYTTDTETVTTDTADTTDTSEKPTDASDTSVEQISSDVTESSVADSESQSKTDTEAKQDKPDNKKGCGSSVGGGATLLISVLIAAFAVFTKKKKY